jgi:hypothetical protein
MRWRSARSDREAPPPRGAAPTRRAVLAAGAGIAAACVSGLASGRARAASFARLTFDDLYEASGVLGLRFSRQLLAAKGTMVTLQGYMAPPLRAESRFFVLTREPVSICPFCSSDAEWPTDIVVIYLVDAAAPTRFSDPISVTGRLEVGSWTDPETGFVSQIRLVDAAFRIV